jgi:hypothetical protein
MGAAAQLRFPDNPFAWVVRARVRAVTTHSVEPLRELLRRTDLEADMRKSVATEVATQEERYRDAITLWESRTDVDAPTRLLAVALLYQVAGDATQAEQRLRTVEHQLAGNLSTQPSDEVMMNLALAQSVLAEHASAIATIEQARARVPESLDHVNGPSISFVRSVILARAGRTAEAYAEVDRLLRVPFGTLSLASFFGEDPPLYLLLKDDRHFDALIEHPPPL